jgi:hypothetical protein
MRGHSQGEIATLVSEYYYKINDSSATETAHGCTYLKDENMAGGVARLEARGPALTGKARDVQSPEGGFLLRWLGYIVLSLIFMGLVGFFVAAFLRTSMYVDDDCEPTGPQRDQTKALSRDIWKGRA